MILFIIKLLVIALIAACTYLSIKTCFTWVKHRKIIDFLNKTPSFSPLLTNSYIRLSGRTKETNLAYTSYHVTAEWKDKLKKPDKGYQLVKKPIHQEIGEQVLIVISGNDHISISPGNFERDGINLIHTKTSHSKRCPEAALTKDTPRYHNYYETNKKLEGDELVSVYGKLVKRDGVLHLVPTQEKGFPSVLATGGTDVIHKFFLKEINLQYKSELMSSLLALTALLLIYVIFLT